MAQKSNRNITPAFAKSGMNKDAHPSQLTEQEYTHAFNANIQTESGDFLNITNEHSNILATKFKEGFVVIGFENDLFSDSTYFLLLNPSSGIGEFGEIVNNQSINDLPDLTVDCGDCNEVRDLATPLEDISQVPLQQYVTLISDEYAYDLLTNSCYQYSSPTYINNKLGFNFNIDYPIKSIVIKNEKCGKNIYFSDNLNPPRHINITNLSDYYVRKQPCGTPFRVNCIDFDELRVSKLFSFPKLVASELQLGGSLKMGVYEFMIAYCDSAGNEISPYYSITRPISIYDKNNRILSQPEIADRTNFSIRLEVTELDTRYSYYKIAVIQTADVDGATRYFIEGIHPINSQVVTYSTEQGKTTTSEIALTLKALDIEKSEGLVAVNNRLYQHGLTIKKELNLQPVVNFMGQFLKWQTHIALENLYDTPAVGANFVGYNRDEVVPFGIRFLVDGGYETAVFPFIGRQPLASELSEIAQYDIATGGLIATPGLTAPDVKSILDNSGACVTTGRTQRWQYYNTATEDIGGTCIDINSAIKTTTVYQDIVTTCEVETLLPIPSGFLEIELNNSEYSGLQDYINDNNSSLVACQTAFPNGTNICQYLDSSQYVTGYDCGYNPFDGANCPAENITTSYTILASSIDGLVESFISKPFPSGYGRIPAPSSCSLYLTEQSILSGTSFVQDSSNPLGYNPGNNASPLPVYVRDSSFDNELCVSAKDIVLLTNSNQNLGESVFFNYYVATNSNNTLLQTKTGLATGANFYSQLHKGALWFRGETETKNEFILDVSKIKAISPADAVSQGNSSIIRVSIFKTCNSQSPIFSYILNVQNSGDSLLLKRGMTTAGVYNQDLEIQSSGNLVPITLIPNGWVGNSYYVSVDCPIMYKLIDTTPSFGTTNTPAFYVSPIKGCITITKRDVEHTGILVTWEKINLIKRIEYTAKCEFQQPIINSCEAIPFKKGNFAYWESQEIYPDNDELFNSSSIKISPNQLPASIRPEFESAFTSGRISNAEYIYKTSGGRLPKSVVDFTCRPIRHFKFPDNSVAPFISNTQQSPLASTIIYPLGVTIDESAIKAFLDIAVDNGLISKEERNKIKKYEILRGDISSNRSVIASGLLYDMRQYRESKKSSNTVLYPNYPYNSYSDDILNLLTPNETMGDRRNLGEGAIWGDSNRNYTFHSPETDYLRPNLPSELSVQGYMFGYSKGNFDQVKNHPKWVILTPRIKALASTLAIAEVAAEFGIQASQAFANYQFGFGVVFSGGAISAGVILGLGIGVSAAYRVGQARYAWLKIFRDLGTPHNFASYYFSEGNYNYISPISLPQQTGNTLRGVNTAKYLQEGRFIITNETTGEKLNINNIDRERSVFLSFGKNKLNYPSAGYKLYDKRPSDSSLFYLSQAGGDESGRSRDILRKIASPYVALKNYIPAQYGSISSIKWLPTSFIGDVAVNHRPTTGCLSIFGGDTYISRHTLKRKMPLFLVNSMKQANLTPFNYYFYNNIGTNPKFYCSYEIDKDFSSNSATFPDIDSDFSFDNLTRTSNYYTPPSKFYLYYYGVPSFLAETRMNTNFRYAGKEYKENFYPLVGDLGDWTQEVNVSIKEPNIFRYNNTYSKSSFCIRNRKLKDTYNKKFDDCAQDMPNGIISSLPDSNENSLYDPWLIFRPLDTFEFPAEYGRLKGLIGLEDSSVLARFRDTSVIYNRVDTKIDTGAEVIVANTGGNAIFQRRPTTLSNTDLGFAGTQNFTKVSCEFGHFWADAKRGQVLALPAAGGTVSEISSTVGGKPNGMRNWFKEHLPFKILRRLPNVDTDNPYNGVGLIMGWDSRFRRVFLTKKDYLPKSECIQFEQGKGFFYKANARCIEDNVSDIELTCPAGYEYNDKTKKCVRNYVVEQLCPEGYSYDSLQFTCTKQSQSAAVCTCEANVSATPTDICSGNSVNIPLTSTAQGTTFQWTATQQGVSGATSGTGTSIQQMLSATGDTIGTATYSITPIGPDGCTGEPLSIVVRVYPIPTVVAVANNTEIGTGQPIQISLSSNLPNTNYSWTVIQNGVQGASNGAGNFIQQMLEGSGTVQYTITPTAGPCIGDPVTVVIKVNGFEITENTQINIWFDNSVSMENTYAPLSSMVNNNLKSCLLPYYNNNSTLYNERVKILDFSSIPDSDERYIKHLTQVSSNPSVTKTINLVFIDESSAYGADFGYPTSIAPFTATDVANLRSTLQNVPPNSLLGVVFRVDTLDENGDTYYTGFRPFLQAMHEAPGTAPYLGNSGLSDKSEIRACLDVIAEDTPQYYLTTITAAINTLGFNITTC
jgi:hypothetical protein